MKHYMETPCCFGKYDGASNKCWGCECAPCCKWQKEDREEGNTMYMEIKITKPAETQEKSAPTMEELVNKRMLLEDSKVDLARKILNCIEHGECDQTYFRNVKLDYKVVCEELAKVEQKIQLMDEESDLLSKYWDLLNDRRNTHYTWMVAQLEGEKKVVENAYKDIVETEHAIWETERKLLDLRDRKFAQK